MESISIESSLKRDPDQIFSKVDHEVIMLSLNEGKYYALNEVATRIWELIEKPIIVKDLIKKLYTEFDVSSNVCEKDTLELLNDLHEQGLIVIC